MNTLLSIGEYLSFFLVLGASLFTALTGIAVTLKNHPDIGELLLRALFCGAFGFGFYVLLNYTINGPSAHAVAVLGQENADFFRITGLPTYIGASVGAYFCFHFCLLQEETERILWQLKHDVRLNDCQLIKAAAIRQLEKSCNPLRFMAKYEWFWELSLRGTHDFV